MNAFFNKLKKTRKLYEKSRFLKLVLVIAVIIVPALSFSAGQIAAQSIVPLVDHHTHIWSLNASTLVTPPLLPAVKLPEDLTLLVSKREQAWNNKGLLLDLYTEDALMLDSRGEKSGWMRGRDAVAEQVSVTFGRPYMITPVMYQIDGSIASIAGYFARQDGSVLKPFGNVSLSLKKKQWRKVANFRRNSLLPGAAYCRRNYSRTTGKRDGHCRRETSGSAFRRFLVW